MTGLWLVLGLLVAAEAASISTKSEEIPVEVVYDDQPILAKLSKNLQAKPHISLQEQVEADILHIPEVIAKVAPAPSNDEPSKEDSSQSVESSEEVVHTDSKSSEESAESNELDNIIKPVEAVQEVAPEGNVKFVPNEDTLRQANSTTARPPNRPILGLINRLGETIGNTIGNTINSIRPQSPPASSTATPPVAPVENLVSDGPLPIAAATAEDEVVASSTAPPVSTTAPSFANNLQQNINNQLNNFGNRVNGFIDNLRPKQPGGSQNDEEPTTPNTPVINGIQNQFNSGLNSFVNTVNGAFGYFNNPNNTQSDETGQQNTNPIIQTIVNSAANFQQSFSQFINQNQNNQQSDEASPNVTNTNPGIQVLNLVQQGIQNIVQNFRPNNSQSDEAAPSQPNNPITSGIQNLFGWGQQFFGGQQNNTLGIPSQIPNPAQQFPNLTNQIPGADQLQNLTSQFPGANQFQNFNNQFPGAGQLQNLTAQLPGASQLQNFTGQFSGVPQFPTGGQIPQIPGLPTGIPEIPGIPGLPDIPGVPGLPGQSTSSPSSTQAPPPAP